MLSIYTFYLFYYNYIYTVILCPCVLFLFRYTYLYLIMIYSDAMCIYAGTMSSRVWKFTKLSALQIDGTYARPRTIRYEPDYSAVTMKLEWNNNKHKQSNIHNLQNQSRLNDCVDFIVSEIYYTFYLELIFNLEIFYIQLFFSLKYRRRRFELPC